MLDKDIYLTVEKILSDFDLIVGDKAPARISAKNLDIWT